MVKGGKLRICVRKERGKGKEKKEKSTSTGEGDNVSNLGIGTFGGKM